MTGATDPGNSPDGSGDRVSRLEQDLRDVLLPLGVDPGTDAESTGAASQEQQAAPAEAATNTGEHTNWSRHIAELYWAKYGVAMVYPTVKEEHKVDAYGRETTQRKTDMVLVGYILVMDHTPTGIVALYKDGAHDFLPAPPDPEGEQKFRARFIAGGAPFVLMPETTADVPRQLFLDQAIYDHEGLRQYDNHDHGNEASLALAEAVRAAPRLAEERRAAKERNIGHATLALEGVFPPEEPKQQ